VGRAVTPLLARQGPLVPHQDVTIGAVEMKTRSSQAQLALYGQPPGSYRLRVFSLLSSMCPGAAKYGVWTPLSLVQPEDMSTNKD
jgi:hypothetical protein